MVSFEHAWSIATVMQTLRCQCGAEKRYKVDKENKKDADWKLYCPKCERSNKDNSIK